MPEHITSSFPSQGSITPNPEAVRHLVLKLRWIGMEEQTEEMAARMAMLAPDDVLVEAAATD